MQTLVLEGELGMRDAPELAHRLAAALAEGGAMLDPAPLGSVDAAILQVLIAAFRTATEMGVPFGFTNPAHAGLRAALIGHGMVASDGSPLTPEHDFWTGAVPSSRGETA